MGSNISTAVEVCITNCSDVSMIVYDAQTIASDTVDVDEALRRREAEACLQGVSIPAHAKITLRRYVGTSLRFWTSDGKMAFAEFISQSNNNNDDDDDDDDDDTNVFGPEQVNSESSRRRPRLTLSPQYVERKRAKDSLTADIFVHQFISELPLFSIFEGHPLREDIDHASPFQSKRSRWYTVKFTNVSSHEAEIFTYDSDAFGRRMLYENLRPGRNTIINTHMDKPWTFLDEEGERMMFSWCWWEKESEEEEEVLHEASSTVFFAPPSCHSYIQVDARINTPTLKALTVRLLRRMRQRNGLEWPRDRIPATFIEELERVEDRDRFKKQQDFRRGNPLSIRLLD